MINPKYFTDRALQVRFNFFLASHHIHHANSKLTIKTNYVELGIETGYNFKNLKDIVAIYAR